MGHQGRSNWPAIESVTSDLLRASPILHRALLSIAKIHWLARPTLPFHARGGMKARVFALAIAVALRTGGLAGASAPAAGAWQKLAEEDGISVYGREVSGVSLLAMRGEGVVDAPILRVASVLIDTSR